MKGTKAMSKSGLVRGIECPACSARVHRRLEGKNGVYTCTRCGALHGECYLGDSYELVHPFWAEPDVPQERTRYFDLMCLGSTGLQRRHGWCDTQTRRVVQIG